jgi:HK97 family phage portal protein
MSLLSKLTDNKPSKPPVAYSKRTAGSSAFGTISSGKDPIEQMSSVGTLFAIVNRTSTATAAVEWDLYTKAADGKVQSDEERKPAGKHAAIDIWRRPNSFMTRYELVERCQQHIDLVGETYLIVVKAGQIPIELWPVRPDRMTPVADAGKYLAGYIYKDPDNNKIPLNVDEVIHIKMPNPTDPFRGLGPVQAIMTEIDSAKYSAEWNRNFFANSAEPGGVIELPTNLSDAQWEEFTDRWRSQHQGVRNAHRVAVIEHAGKYVPRGYSQRDMEFTALREASRDTIMEAFGASKPMLGITDDVNRANAEASIFMFAQYLLKPRLRRWAEALNHQLLPMFGGTGDSVEFDFEDPVEENSESAALDRTSRVDAVVKLAGLQGVKFDVDALLEAFDLPVIPWEEMATPLPGQMFGPDGEVLPPPPVAPPGGGESGASQTGKRGTPPGGAPSKPTPGKPKPPGKPKNEIVNEAPEVDLSGHQSAWQRVLAHLLEAWTRISGQQRADLGRQIAKAVDSKDLGKLADLSVDSAAGAAKLKAALIELHTSSSADVVAQAAAVGIVIGAVHPDEEELGQVASTSAELLAHGLAVAAGREAVRRWDGQSSGNKVADEVMKQLAELSDRQLRDVLGGALTGAQNRARVATYAAGPIGSLYADETLDENTCRPCRSINGRFIATTDDLAPLDRLYTSVGGYVDCLTAARCRGTVTGVWRPDTEQGTTRDHHQLPTAPVPG